MCDIKSIIYKLRYILNAFSSKWLFFFYVFWKPIFRIIYIWWNIGRIKIYKKNHIIIDFCEVA